MMQKEIDVTALGELLIDFYREWRQQSGKCIIRSKSRWGTM